MTTPDSRKLLFGSLLVGASAFPLGGVVSGILAGVGGNWLAESVGSALGAGPPPGVALQSAFTRAVQRAASNLRTAYGAERVQRDGNDAFDLLRQSARRLTEVAFPTGVTDLPGVQRVINGSLGQVLYDFPDSQVALLRERLLDETARIFYEELARDSAAWQLYHSWIMARLLQQHAALQQALATQPTAQTMLMDADALADRLDEFTTQVATLLAQARMPVSHPPSPPNQFNQSGGNSAGMGNTFQGPVQIGNTTGPVIHGKIRAGRDVNTATQQTITNTGGAPASAPTPAPTPGAPQIILALFATPRGTVPLNWLRELQVLQACIEPYFTRCTLVPLPQAGVDALLQAFHRYRPALVHLSLHGAGEDLLFTDALGDVQPVTRTVLLDALAQIGSVRGVILNACGPLSAPPFAAGRFPFDTILMQGAISDDAARRFTRGFYEAYAPHAGTTVAQACAAAVSRLAVHREDADVPLLVRGQPYQSGQ